MSTTKAEHRMLQVLHKWFASNEVSPSLRVLREDLGLRSLSPVHSTLTRLRDKGLVTWEPKRKYTLALTELGRQGNRGQPPADLVEAASAVLKSIKAEDPEAGLAVVSSVAIGDLDLALADLPARSETVRSPSAAPS